MKCPNCNREIDSQEVIKQMASKGGKSRSKAKTRASRINGRKGGRPRKPLKAEVAINE